MNDGSSSPATRNTRPPLAQAAFGVGVIVRDGEGRILLGRHRDGTWELPGGKIDPTHESSPGSPPADRAARRHGSVITGTDLQRLIICL